ncbi:oxygen-independent coproporphyrinogen-3 oxidase [Desulfobaculum xiamenense]|uniref:Heme chaperone HemW n=1 Tax=Desulfobaculum xiamenense TaxID=995050 RepID=A0A846QNN6_9BACT|nr:radical SAM family heme chaperone HemW [Desulfobaculum xiamenense]NJB68630.1 oxygen-independent coproporphyrinogen-3 oxidase [Desulfobaculum xiamenense]
MLLYVHVPFCRRKCRYCAFHSTVPAKGDLAAYATLAEREIRHWGRTLGHPEIRTIFFGGGTPSLLPLPQWGRLVTAIRESFTLLPNLEFTTEANPESLTDWAYLQGLMGFGVNRLSMGVQSTDDAMLTLLGRPHTAADAHRAFDLARNVGFANISVDLIWGLPGQRLATWLHQLREIVRWRPEHMSCYGLSFEPGTPFEHMLDTGDITPVDEQEQAKMFIHGAEYLESEGYLQYEISNFARMGFTSRHNLGYWEGEDYLGIGPSAVSTLNARRWQNPTEPKAYARAIESGTLGGDFEALDAATHAREMVMLRLRTARGLHLADYHSATGRDFLKDFGPMVQALRQNGLVRLSQGHLRLSKTGMIVSDTILGNLFDSPVWDAPAPDERHPGD